jgi:hypothetical protein
VPGEGTSSAARGLRGEGALPRLTTRRSRHRRRVRGSFFLSNHPFSFSRFIVLGRARVRRTTTLSRARSNREITRDPTSPRSVSWTGRRRPGSRLVVQGQRTSSSSLDPRTTERPIERSFGRARGSQLHE